MEIDHPSRDRITALDILRLFSYDSQVAVFTMEYSPTAIEKPQMAINSAKYTG
jgi:hypothetical protein